ncbi:serine protease Do [Desulfitobacterium sp. LBE]|uniref:S1C family serine protease n=1 Tax=Desulfitobacterium sp. LBE TaxID=884086 RepID=UPI00119BC469|nr:trypsin-like peptidase domain-containing protein [Desulfitobacterium sp. LBE]TWH56044.1 serine protease Do [Desulfitobacterium sp. LBE]
MFEGNINTQEDNASVQNDTSSSIPEMTSEVPFHGGSKKPGTRYSALALAACVAASGLFGFAGGYVSDQIQGASSDTATVSQTEVLYQSVIRTVASGDSSVNAAMTVSEVAAAVKQTVVEITTETMTTNGRMGQLITEGAGSGVIISSDGYIVTNNHVVAGARSIAVRLADGTECTASLVGTDAKSDLAVLKINATGLTPAVLGDSSSLLVGETMVAVGNPLGELGGTVTSGILSALDREITIDGESMRLLQTDTAINPGNSGGGLFNLYGELIGIVNAKSSGTDVEGLGFAIPINSAKTVMENIIEYGYVQGRIDTGFTLIDLTSAQTAMMYRVNKTGLYIYESTNSQLKSGDKIISIDGTEITNMAGYNAVMKSHKVGDTIKVTVLRNNQNLTVSIILGELRS